MSWFPASIRDYLTDFLSFVARLSDTGYKPFANCLTRSLALTGDDRLVDLCSGAGAPAVAIAALLRERGRDVRVTLTDLYPNRERLRALAEAAPGRVDFVDASVDATAV